MAGLKKYNVTTENGYTTTLLLSDEDAKARGLTGKDVESTKASPAPSNKAVKAPSNK